MSFNASDKSILIWKYNQECYLLLNLSDSIELLSFPKRLHRIDEEVFEEKFVQHVSADEAIFLRETNKPIIAHYLEYFPERP